MAPTIGWFNLEMAQKLTDVSIIMWIARKPIESYGDGKGFGGIVKHIPNKC
jgi:hypothetical protein